MVDPPSSSQGQRQLPLGLSCLFGKYQVKDYLYISKKGGFTQFQLDPAGSSQGSRQHPWGLCGKFKVKEYIYFSKKGGSIQFQLDLAGSSQGTRQLPWVDVIFTGAEGHPMTY